MIRTLRKLKSYLMNGPTVRLPAIEPQNSYSPSKPKKFSAQSQNPPRQQRPPAHIFSFGSRRIYKCELEDRDTPKIYLTNEHNALYDIDGRWFNEAIGLPTYPRDDKGRFLLPDGVHTSKKHEVGTVVRTYTLHCDGNARVESIDKKVIAAIEISDWHFYEIAMPVMEESRAVKREINDILNRQKELLNVLYDQRDEERRVIRKKYGSSQHVRDALNEELGAVNARYDSQIQEIKKVGSQIITEFEPMPSLRPILEELVNRRT